MSYEEAPACRMLATQCVICGRPLLDARSVETGVGPDCRAECGIDDGDVDEGQRALCNQLTHRAAVFAARGQVTEVRKCAAAIRAAGLSVLATLIEERFRGVEKRAKIFVTTRVDEQRTYFITPFRRGAKAEFLAAMRALPGRRWHGDGLGNSLPTAHKAALWAFMRRFFPGEYGVGEEGPFRIPGEGEEA